MMMMTTTAMDEDDDCTDVVDDVGVAVVELL